MRWFPVSAGIIGATGLVATLLALFAAVAMWSRLPALLDLPSTQQLIDANRKLAAEQKAGRVLVETLRGCMEELETRVAARTQDLQDAIHRFEVGLANSNITISQQDLDLRYTWVHNPPGDLADNPIIGLTPQDLLTAPTADLLIAAKRSVLETGAMARVEMAVPSQGETLWFEARIEPLMRDGTMVGLTTVAIDVTAQKDYEKHLHTVLRELTHRSKNLLAIVSGIARQTASSGATLPEFMEAFSARLQTLADAHGLLIEHSWRGVELRELILLETGGDHPPLQNRLTIEGKREILGPEAAQNLALGLHEMITNAYRHGALSGPLGSIAIAWQRVQVESRAMLELTWIETGGATVPPPERSGFGRSLIERLVPRAIEGTSQLIFAPEGVRWTLRFPIERLGQEA
ncbi:MAG: sensor histidine kinase [Elstera sp.]